MASEKILENIEKLRGKLSTQAPYYRRRYKYYYGQNNTLVNLIYGTINQFMSLVYDGDNIVLEPRLDDSLEYTDVKPFIEEVSYRLSKVISEDFKNTKSNVELRKIVLDSLITKNGFGKVIYTEPWTTPYVIRINPFNLALGYNSFAINNRQQILLHRTYMSESEFENLFGQANLTKIRKVQEQHEETEQEAMNIATQIAPSSATQASYNFFSNSYADRRLFSSVLDELIEISEYWEYDYSKKLWQQTQASNGIILRQQDYMHNPFFSIVAMDYSTDKYGFSMVDLLDNIQDRIEDIYDMVNNASRLMANPPVLVSGYNINSDNKQEIEDAIHRPGSAYIIDGQSMKIQPYDVGLQPNVAIEEKQALELDAQKVMSMTSIMQGVPASNVRSASYAQILSQFSSAPIKSVAINIEKQIEDLFNFLSDIYIFSCDTKYKTKEGDTYNFSNLALSQWGRIVVYAHSTSPIIKDSNEQLLLNLAEANIVPKDVIIDILDLPFKDKIKEFLSKQEMNQQTMAAMKAEQAQGRPAPTRVK